MVSRVVTMAHVPLVSMTSSAQQLPEVITAKPALSWAERMNNEVRAVTAAGGVEPDCAVGYWATLSTFAWLPAACAAMDPRDLLPSGLLWGVAATAAAVGPALWIIKKVAERDRAARLRAEHGNKI